MQSFDICVEEGGDIAHNVWDDGWFHILNLFWVAANHVLVDMCNERPVDVGDILIFVVDGGLWRYGHFLLCG